MSRSLTAVGISVLAASAVGAGVNLWARHAFPEQWGGPNIGGGLLQLLCYAGVVAGVVITLIGLVRRRDS
ncbi:hypothetical protein DV517_09940 [Streptomyces sp. S816]|nr:hypothetical protein DV517_09940 [Streptomyces sp. S816]